MYYTYALACYISSIFHQQFKSFSSYIDIINKKGEL